MKLLKYLALLAAFTSVSVMAAESGKKDNEPKNEQTTTGFMQEITETRVHRGPARSGEEVYQFRCKGCHGKNTQGAPMPDDKFEWSSRMKKGLAVLYKHSIDGYKNYLMPPMGGCRNCSDQEVYAAVRYMIERSGVVLPQEDIKESKQ